MIQTWGNFGWSFRTFRLALCRLHRWKNWLNSQNHQQRLMKYHFRNCWQVRPFICQWIIREHLNMWWMSMKCMPLLLTDEQSVACVCVPFKVRSNEADEIWVYVTIQKPNSSPLNGLSLPCPCLKSSQTSRRWWQFFFDFEGIFHWEFFFLEAKRLTGITIRTFCNVWRRKSAEDVQNDGRTRTGWLNITMCTVLFQCSNFWLLKVWLCSPTLLTCLICLLVLWVKSKLWGPHFKDTSEIQEQLLTIPNAIQTSQ